MSDNEDLLGDDLGDQSLADYNLGNEEEEQLLADDYDAVGPQNVPTSLGPGYREADILPPEYPPHPIEYGRPIPYQPVVEPECVVPNISVEIPNAPLPDRPTYAPYQPPVYEERAVPPAMPAAALESPQIVPTDMLPPVPNGDMGGPRERFVSERPPGQRMPQVRDIPDSLDKVVIPRGGFGGRGRMSWGRAYARFNHPYRRNNMHRGNFHQRVSFPPPQVRHPHIQMRAEIRPEIRPDIRVQIRPDLRPEIHPEPEIRSDMRPEIRPEARLEIAPDMRPDIQTDMRPEIRPNMRPEIHHEMRPDIHPDMRPDIRPDMRPDIRPDMRPDIRPDMRPDIRLDMRPDIRPDLRPDIRPDMRPDIRPDIRLDIRPDLRPDIHPDMRPDICPDVRPDLRPNVRMDIRPDLRPDIHGEMHPDMRPEIHADVLPPGIGPDIRLPLEVRPDVSLPPPLGPNERDIQFRERAFQGNFPRFPYRPALEERPPYPPGVGPRPMFPYPRQFRPFGPVREVAPGAAGHMPQVTIRQALPDKGREPEVRMLPVPIPPNLPVTGKKVLINPHFKGTFQPPTDGPPTYIPTRIQKSPPLSPTLKEKFGPIKDLDDATERFIAEQRSALARAAGRKLPRRSPQRYIENTTIEIENELAHPSGRRRSEDDDLFRRQEEFINANRAGLRRRMRSPTPPRRSPSPPPPRRSPERRPRLEPPRREPHNDEESEYRRRLREQENLRERVLRAKEVRRRKNAVALQKQIQDRERENLERDAKPAQKPEEAKPEMVDKPTSTEDNRPDTTRDSPEKPEMEAAKDKPEAVKRERSPVGVVKEEAEVNSTCEGLTPPRAPPKPASPERALTPPLPPRAEREKPERERKRDWLDSEDDDLDLILGDIDGILSDDDDSGRFKQKADKTEPPSKASTQVDLRSKLPPKTSSNDSKKPQRQKIVFNENKERDERKRKVVEKSPPVRPVVTSSTKTEVEITARKALKTKSKTELTTSKLRQRIIFDKEQEREREAKEDTKTSSSQPNRRVILQRKIQVSAKEKAVFGRVEADPGQAGAGIFSRAVRTAVGGDARVVVRRQEDARVVARRQEEAQVEYASESDADEDALLDADSGIVALVANLPHGMTDTRLKTLAGGDVQSLNLDKEERKAKITFKTTIAAENFKKKFNNKMVAASRLTVTLG